VCGVCVCVCGGCVWVFVCECVCVCVWCVCECGVCVWVCVSVSVSVCVWVCGVCVCGVCVWCVCMLSCVRCHGVIISWNATRCSILKLAVFAFEREQIAGYVSAPHLSPSTDSRYDRREPPVGAALLFLTISQLCIDIWNWTRKQYGLTDLDWNDCYFFY
jgi:hypothetical protein